VISQLIVIGGGYAGVMAANRAAGRSAHVTLINGSADFVERIRLHEVATGIRDSAELSLLSLLHPDVELVVGWAERIDADGQMVKLADGRSLSYTNLVYAVGSTSAKMPTESFGVASNREAVALRARLAALQFGIVDVIGAGLTGVEVAAEIATVRPDLRVRLRARGGVGASLGPGSERAIRRRLERLGVEVSEHAREPASEGEAHIAVMTSGFAVPGLARHSGLPVSARGHLLVGSDLVVPGRPEIVGAGDAVLVAGARHLRMSCAAALPQGAHAVDTIFDGPRPLNAGFMLQCVSLGRRDGWVQHVSTDDRPRAAHLSGTLGAIGKEAMSRRTVRWLRREAAKPGSFRWPSGPPLEFGKLVPEHVP
jgi:NADH dehydrogenase FAD-containing subunit